MWENECAGDWCFSIGMSIGSPAGKGNLLRTLPQFSRSHHRNESFMKLKVFLISEGWRRQYVYNWLISFIFFPLPLQASPVENVMTHMMTNEGFWEQMRVYFCYLLFSCFSLKCWWIGFIENIQYTEKNDLFFFCLFLMLFDLKCKGVLNLMPGYTVNLTYSIMQHMMWRFSISQSLCLPNSVPPVFKVHSLVTSLWHHQSKVFRLLPLEKHQTILYSCP